MGTLPTVQVHSPSDAPTAAALVDHALGVACPKYFRMDGKPLPALQPSLDPTDFAAGFRVLRNGRHVLAATGYMVHKALRLADRLPAGTLGVVDVFRPRPVDADLLAECLRPAETVVTLEEGFIGAGGLDAAVRRCLDERGLLKPFRALGFRDGYRFEIGSREYLHALAGLGEDDLCTFLVEWTAPALSRQDA